MLTLSNDERGYLSEAEQERLGIISIPELKELRTIPFVDKDTVVAEDSTSTASEISSGYKSSSQKDLMRLIRNISDKDNK